MEMGSLGPNRAITTAHPLALPVSVRPDECLRMRPEFAGAAEEGCSNDLASQLVDLKLLGLRPACEPIARQQQQEPEHVARVAVRGRI
jgi:hypothetical protein